MPVTGRNGTLNTKSIAYISLLSGLALIYTLLMYQNILFATLFAALPLILVVFGLFIHRPDYCFFGLYILNYFIAGLTRYVSFKSGILMLCFVLGLLGLIALRNNFKSFDWQRAKNPLTLLWFIWFVYCLAELFNPQAMIMPWFISITSYALYPLLLAIMIPIMFTRFKHLKWILILWAALTVLAAAKGYWQRNRGFDAAELHWLFVDGGAKTHLIHSGIRFFSFFSDAANFGTSMGLSMIVFSISAIYIKNIWMKIVFLIAAIAGGYGMIIAGTRSSMAVPFAGIAFFLLLCKNYKIIFGGITILLFAYLFFNHTTIGNDNPLIKRMRTSFDFNDASFQIRLNNQERIREEMKYHPFGVGLGLGGGKAKEYKPGSPLANIPTDSWMVMTWVETGVIGVLLYITLLTLILWKGAKSTIKNIKNKELRGLLFGLLSGVFGLLISSFGNEVLNYPNGILIFTALALVFSGKWYDKELSETAKLSKHE